jgi:cell division septation protein DedD
MAQEYGQRRRVVTNVIVGSLTFATVVALMAFAAMTALKNKTMDRILSQQDPQATASDLPPLFYRSIGQTPADFRKNPRSGPDRTGQKAYTIEFAIATSKEEAELWLSKLHGQGILAYYTPLQRDGRVVYRVRQGVFTKQESAITIAQAIDSSKGIKTNVIRLQ